MIRRHVLTVAFAMLAVLATTQCRSVDPVRYKPLTFKHYQPIYMAVSKIDVVHEYQSSAKAPYVEHLLPYSPAEAFEIWVKDRLRTVGGESSLQVIIKDASVTSTELPQPPGFKGFVTNSQDKEYKARLEVEMRAYGQRAMSDASIKVSASRTITVAKNASVDQRQVIFRKMMADLIETINSEIEKNLYMYMSNYISYSQTP
jgi:hypothetical protein